jgi:hypothetical protein
MFVTDVWDDIRELTQERKPCAIPTAHGFARNRLLFALLLRILLASTKVDDWILDPFAGTGTTLVVAEQLQQVCRKGFTFILMTRYLWIGAVALSLLALREANSSQPPVARTGAPFDNGSCGSCHTGGSPA